MLVLHQRHFLRRQTQRSVPFAAIGQYFLLICIPTQKIYELFVLCYGAFAPPKQGGWNFLDLTVRKNAKAEGRGYEYFPFVVEGAGIEEVYVILEGDWSGKFGQFVLFLIDGDDIDPTVLTVVHYLLALCQIRKKSIFGLSLSALLLLHLEFQSFGFIVVSQTNVMRDCCGYVVKSTSIQEQFAPSGDLLFQVVEILEDQLVQGPLGFVVLGWKEFLLLLF